MISFLTWYVLLSALGWLTFPVAFRHLKKLPSRGFAFSKILGLVLWGFIFWLLTSLGLFRNDLSGQVTALIVLICISIISASQGCFKALIEWVKANGRLIIITEMLFLVAFSIWALVRSANPLIIGTEKPMEMAFINSILKSPTFPPNDPWLSGYGISYYYFGYVIIAMLIRISGVSAGIGYNLSAALWFALTAIGAYGIVYDLTRSQWMAKNENHPEEAAPAWVFFAPLIAPLLILIVSNLHGFLDVLHARGVFWISDSVGGQSSAFWQWIQLKELDIPPIDPVSWMPKRLGGVQWWGASRVLQDFNLQNAPIEIIDEFPFFTYLLSDLHPHVLAMPLVIMLIGVAYNTFRGGLEEKTKFFRWDLPIPPRDILLISVLIGSLIFMNTWDSPFYLALIAAGLLLRNFQQKGWSWKRVLEFIAIMMIIGILAILLFLPFFAGFDSQAGGIFPSLIFYTRGVYFWVMFAPLLVPVIVYLLMLWKKHKGQRSGRLGRVVSLSLLGGLFIFTWVASFIASRLPDLGEQFLWLQGAGEVGIWVLLWEALKRRLLDPLTGITLGIMIALSIGLLFVKRSETENEPSLQGNDHTDAFVVLIILLGALLTIIPEFIYLRDQFAVRMNTIFKFYFQAWILWGIAGSVGIIQLWRKAGKWNWVSRIGVTTAVVLFFAAFFITLSPELARDLSTTGQGFGTQIQDWFLLVAALFLMLTGLVNLLRQRWLIPVQILVILVLLLGSVYPLVAMWYKIGVFPELKTLTLDGTAYYRQINSDQMAAVNWLTDAPLGVMVEAVSPTGGSYTGFARVSTFSGMPTVLGWVGHVLQWRGGSEELGSRQNDITRLYSTTSWEDAYSIIKTYDIRYIYIGDLERSTYQLQEAKFEDNMQLVFQSRMVKIYEIIENE